MADTHNPQSREGFFPMSRRAAMGGLSAAGIAAAAAPAAAALGTQAVGLREFRGEFPVTADATIDGLFIAPVGGRNLDVVLLVPQAGSSHAAITESARRLAGQGAFAVAPRLPANHDDRLAQIAKIKPALAAMAHTSGRVRVVTI
jgi:hypothetical protein